MLYIAKSFFLGCLNSFTPFTSSGPGGRSIGLVPPGKEAEGSRRGIPTSPKGFLKKLEKSSLFSLRLPGQEEKGHGVSLFLMTGDEGFLRKWVWVIFFEWESFLGGPGISNGGDDVNGVIMDKHDDETPGHVWRPPREVTWTSLVWKACTVALV